MNRPGIDTDDALVARCLEGCDDAWRIIVDRHRPRLIELARRIVGSPAAEDVVDAVIADLWERRKLTRYAGRSSLATWLGAIVINAALNARRSARARADSETAEHRGRGPTLNDPSAGTESQLSAVLHAAIAALPTPWKVLVLMYYEQGLTLDQAGALLGWSKSTLSRSLRQARERIRAEADRLAHDRFGATLDALRTDADLTQLDLDLRAACAFERDRPEGRGSNS